MEGSTLRSSQLFPLLACLVLSSLFASLESTPAFRSADYPMILQEEPDARSIASSEGYYSRSPAFSDPSSNDMALYSRGIEDGADSDEDGGDMDKRRLRFHKRRLRFNKRRLRFQKKDVPAAMAYAGDENMYQRELRAPRLRFYSLRKRSAEESEDREGQSADETSTESHSRRKRSTSDTSLRNLDDSYPSQPAKRISINGGLEAITHMIVAEMKRRRKKKLDELRRRLLELGKRDLTNERAYAIDSVDDETTEKILMNTLGTLFNL